MTQEGQTCESEGLQPVEDEFECKQAVDYLNEPFEQPMEINVTVVDYTTYPAGCYTSVYDVTMGHFGAAFNTNENMLGVKFNPFANYFVYCKATSMASNSFDEHILSYYK